MSKKARVRLDADADLLNVLKAENETEQDWRAKHQGMYEDVGNVKVSELRNLLPGRRVEARS